MGCSAESGEASAVSYQHASHNPSAKASDKALDQAAADLKAIQQSMADRGNGVAQPDTVTDGTPTHTPPASTPPDTGDMRGKPAGQQHGGMSSAGKMPMEAMGHASTEHASMEDERQSMDSGEKSMTQGMAMQDSMSGAMSMGLCCDRPGMTMGMPPTMTQPTGTSVPEATAIAGHVLHLGEQDFYLDLQAELALTQTQLTYLMAHRSHWVAERDRRQEAIDIGETNLWLLTQEFPPDPERITEAVREVGRARSELRLAFIQSVIEALNTLTPAQIGHARTLSYKDKP